MGSESCRRLPTIDFNAIENDVSQWNLVRSQVHRALEEYGCFEACFNKVPSHLRTAIFHSLRELFDLPLETKMRNMSKKPFHGYIGQSAIVPLYESLGFEDANTLEKVESLTSIYWPEAEGNPSFSKTIQSFSEQMSELDVMIRKMILESLGVEKYLDEHLDSTYYLLRLMKYNAPQTNETEVGLKAHTDKNLVTILFQNQVDGLELQAKNGEWVPIKPLSGSFIVIIGDSLSAWTNGRLVSPYHRVMMRGNEVRYSVGLFSVPKAGITVKAPEELVDEEHPLLFKPFDHSKFLQFYYTEAGQGAESALVTYCGV